MERNSPRKSERRSEKVTMPAGSAYVLMGAAQAAAIEGRTSARIVRMRRQAR
jgi:hypothetical protein